MNETQSLRINVHSEKLRRRDLIKIRLFIDLSAFLDKRARVCFEMEDLAFNESFLGGIFVGCIYYHRAITGIFNYLKPKQSTDCQVSLCVSSFFLLSASVLAWYFCTTIAACHSGAAHSKQLEYNCEISSCYLKGY